MQRLTEVHRRWDTVHLWEHLLWPDCSWWKSDWTQVQRWGVSKCTCACRSTMTYICFIRTTHTPHTHWQHSPDLSVLTAFCSISSTEHAWAEMLIRGSHNQKPFAEMDSSTTDPETWLLASGQEVAVLHMKHLVYTDIIVLFNKINWKHKLASFFLS